MIKSFHFDNSYLRSNTYVLGEKDRPAIVFDLGDVSNQVIEYIKEYHCGSCAGLFLTHGHFDHIRGLNNFFKYFTNTTLFIHRDDVELLNDTVKNCSKLTNENVKVNYTNIYELDDEDEVKFYDNILIKVIHTPFHTEGSVCYLCEKYDVLISGDTLFKESIGRYDLPTSDSSKINESLKKLLSLNKKLKVYPGHGVDTTIEYELKNNLYLKKLEDK